MTMAGLRWLLLLAPLVPALAPTPRPPAMVQPESIWIEAETMGPLRGSNFSFQQEAQQTKGSWSMSGPGVAAEWTQGGESEFMSIAARADEPAGTTVSRQVEVPISGRYTLWVRYADYLGAKEEFGVRVRQGGRVAEHRCGVTPVVDELDPMKLFWGWAFGWDSGIIPLDKGPALVELYTTGPTGARRQVDCLCFTTDTSYHPTGRRKPDFAAWAPLRTMQQAGMPDVAPLMPAPGFELPKAWNVASAPGFVWNVKAPWLTGLTKPAGERIEAAYGVDSALQNDFLAAYKGKEPAIYGSPASGPALYISDYPTAFTDGAPVLQWLDRHPKTRFAILLNYGEPKWPAGADRAAIHKNLTRFGDRFVGFVSGESILHGPGIDQAELEKRVRAAKTRGEILAALRVLHTAAAVKKFSDYYGGPVTPEQAWAPVIPCLSANMEAYAHALMDWGVKRLGHEGTGNSPTLARRLAFMRGAARQFGGKIVDYQSANLGDASMTLARNDLLYPGTSRYILDNQYDAWSGAGINWVLKDYFLFHLAGADVFYHEEGHDLFWKPGGGAAGDGFPVQLSPRGRVTEAVQKITGSHQRGGQLTPIAFLMDEAHGWAQEQFSTRSPFDLNPTWNPKLLTPGRHEASIRGWFDVAYYPAPETQNDPASAIRQTYVNGIFGDLFNVIVTSPAHTEAANNYPVLIASGEVPVSAEWGRALSDHVRKGATLVVCDEQLTGPGVKELDLPVPAGRRSEASAFTWSLTRDEVPSNRFRYRALTSGKDRVLATAPDGSPICTAHALGKGQVITIAAPLGLGIDQRPIPLLGILLRHLTQGLSPVKVTGDVEWVVNRTPDAWLVALLNNRGVIKPQHGVVPIDYDQAQKVTLKVPFPVLKSTERITGTAVPWFTSGGGATTTLTVPAGSIRWIEVHSR